MNENNNNHKENITKMLGMSQGKDYKSIRESKRNIARTSIIKRAGKIPKKY